MARNPVDIDAVMAVMDRAFEPDFGEAWTREQFVGALTMPRTQCLTIDAGGRLNDELLTPPIGFALSRRAVDEEELLLLAVDPAHREKGHARALLASMIAHSVREGIARVFLEMREDNPVRFLYERAGFRVAGRRRSYYRGQDGIARDAISYALCL